MVNFEQLGAPFVVHCAITPCQSPTELILENQNLAQDLFQNSNFNLSNITNILNKNNLENQAIQPVASVYSGHQFGQWAGQLGDGRALLLQTVRDSQGKPQEIQLKGAGPTPYSRFADGRAVLRSSIREFLGSEAMFGLGIPTTRALALFGSADIVWRETAETAAIIARTAPTFVRFGHFEHFHDAPDQIKKLFDWCAENHFNHNNNYKNIIEIIVTNTAEMIAQWQAVGFCHGVMNTDNFSILGLTLDYGPFGFLEQFNPNFICNHSDHSGRYAYARQPEIAYWNISRLLLVLLPNLGLNLDENFDYFLKLFAQKFHAKILELYSNKLGLINNNLINQEIINNWLELLVENQADYTRANRALLFFETNQNNQIIIPEILACEFKNQNNLKKFLEIYQSYLLKNQIANAARQDTMAQHNPAFVLRNWIAQAAIEQAEKNDFLLLNKLFELFKNPYLSPEQTMPSIQINGEEISLNADAPSCIGEVCVSCSS